MKTALLATALAVLSVALALVGPRPASAQGGYLVIVHPGVSVERLSTAELSDMFLKKTERWPDGTRVFPVDQVEASPVRASFSRDVHDRAVAAIKAYWQQRIFSGRDVPPPEKTSDRDVVEYVRTTRGAIGYVSFASPHDGVATVRVEP
jgi:ABC-type phosphate transport system substrate-binding protein